MSSISEYQARNILRQLKATLTEITKRDPEQEVQGIALAPLDAALSSIRDLIPNNPVLAQIEDVISPTAVEAGEPMRAVDVLIVVDLMFAVLKQPPSLPRTGGAPRGRL